MSNAAELYAKIEQDRDLTRALFRQALQNPDGAVQTTVSYTHLTLPTKQMV